MFTIYALIDPRDCSVYYVGCTERPEVRHREHTTGKAQCGARPRNRELLALGLKPGFVVLRTANDAFTAAVLETETIVRFRELGHKLLNQKLKATLKGIGKRY